MYHGKDGLPLFFGDELNHNGYEQIKFRRKTEISPSTSSTSNASSHRHSTFGLHLPHFHSDSHSPSYYRHTSCDGEVQLSFLAVLTVALRLIIDECGLLLMSSLFIFFPIVASSTQRIRLDKSKSVDQGDLSNGGSHSAAVLFRDGVRGQRCHGGHYM